MNKIISFILISFLSAGAFARSSYNVYTIPSSGVSAPTWGQVHLDQSAAVTGVLPFSQCKNWIWIIDLNGMLFGNGTSPIQAKLCRRTQYQVFQAHQGRFNYQSFASRSICSHY